MVVKDNRRKQYSAFINRTGTWVEVRYTQEYLQSGPPDGREGEFMFPQRDPHDTPYARAMSAGGIAVTHIFTNGNWEESNKQIQPIAGKPGSG